MARFWIIAGVLLAWNLVGDVAYLMQVGADDAQLASLDPVQAEAYRSMPTWAWAAYAVAVWSGTLGAILLLMRRRMAWALFALSLLGVIVQFGWSFVVFGLVGKAGAATMIFPAVIAAIAAFATWYARARAFDGTLR